MNENVKPFVDFHLKMYDNVKNLKMLMGLFIEIQPYLPLPKVVGLHGKLPMNVVMDPIWHPLNMWMT
jgi:hypothetical protein